MTSIPTNSHFHPISSPPPPVVLLLAMSDLSLPPAPPLMMHAKLPARAIKRDREPTPSSGPSFPSRFSSPLTSDSGSDDPPTPTATPAPVASSSSSSTTSNGKIIPRPTGAQLRVRSCDIIPKNLRDDLRKRVKTLASQRLDLASPYGKQDKEALRLVESDISAEFPWLLNYQDQWPLQVFLTAVLKYKKSRADVTKMKKLAEALA
ncbi:hypothetical protein B0H16DRAFT_1718140 [Mycena metata]|uniref:Uncharacterized protein n=1 Tax=Mycena metata TaxID=1033252 RepID=A0AAD7NK33_9AGAR|nr:hypothetical protein B0H16DRAFT_1748222 [Mycena metata]KAJ7764198.1 hypothetical protein B0H16DRAFT_1718140 [Mycena metata]